MTAQMLQEVWNRHKHVGWITSTNTPASKILTSFVTFRNNLTRQGFEQASNKAYADAFAGGLARWQAKATDSDLEYTWSIVQALRNDKLIHFTLEHLKKQRLLESKRQQEEALKLSAGDSVTLMGVTYTVKEASSVHCILVAPDGRAVRMGIQELNHRRKQ